jgi:hypothetical protein
MSFGFEGLNGKSVFCFASAYFIVDAAAHTHARTRTRGFVALAAACLYVSAGAGSNIVAAHTHTVASEATYPGACRPFPARYSCDRGKAMK